MKVRMLRPPVTLSAGRARSLASAAASRPSILWDLAKASPMVSADGSSVSGWSTLARELAFVVSHTIHHQAIIGVLLAMHDVAVPERFGHSPSTPRRH